MKAVTAGNDKKKYKLRDKVITFGLSKKQLETVARALPNRDCELFDTDAFTDMIAHQASALIINAAMLEANEVEMMWGFYEEIDCCTDETIFWLGEPKAPKHLRSTFKCYESFDMIAEELKYHLLTAHRKTKKIGVLSSQLADCMCIMKYIRIQPYIRTRDLAEKLGVSGRTVQRYITSLREAGEWISYDAVKKGWYLQFGRSPFFDNF